MDKKIGLKGEVGAVKLDTDQDQLKVKYAQPYMGDFGGYSFFIFKDCASYILSMLFSVVLKELQSCKEHVMPSVPKKPFIQESELIQC